MQTLLEKQKLAVETAAKDAVARVMQHAQAGLLLMEKSEQLERDKESIDTEAQQATRKKDMENSNLKNEAQLALNLKGLQAAAMHQSRTET